MGLTSLTREGEMKQEALEPTKQKETSQGKGNKVMRHMLNTIAGGFSGGGETISVCRRHDHQIINIEDLQSIEG